MIYMSSDGTFDYEKMRHTPGFADYERGVMDRINSQHTSGLAIASLVLGIVWLGGIGALMAVVFGHIALTQMKHDRYLTGRGLAVAGLVLGYVGVLGAVLVYAVAGSAAKELEDYQQDQQQIDRNLDDLDAKLNACADEYEKWNGELSTMPTC